MVLSTKANPVGSACWVVHLSTSCIPVHPNCYHSDEVTVTQAHRSSHPSQHFAWAPTSRTSSALRPPLARSSRTHPTSSFILYSARTSEYQYSPAPVATMFISTVVGDQRAPQIARRREACAILAFGASACTCHRSRAGERRLYAKLCQASSEHRQRAGEWCSRLSTPVDVLAGR